MATHPVIHIDSSDDSRLDVYARLTDNQLRNRLDPTRGVMICESHFVIETALAAGCRTLSFLANTSHTDNILQIVEKFHPLSDDVPIFILPDEQLTQLIGYKMNRGVLCAMRRPQGASLEEILSTSKHIAVLEDLVDVNNVGAVFRSAAALNVDAVILTAKCADNLSRRVLRVSMGTVLKVPWTRLDEETTSLDLIEKLKAHSFTTCALALTDSAVPLNKELVKGKKAALFFGSEGYGLDKKTIKACDITTIIPMSHQVDSLNVAASSAVAFWELFARQLWWNAFNRDTKNGHLQVQMAVSLR